VVYWRPVAEPAATPEVEAELQVEDAPDVAAQRSRDKPTDEGSQYPSDAFQLFIFVCCDILQFTVVTLSCTILPSQLLSSQFVACNFYLNQVTYS